MQLFCKLNFFPNIFHVVTIAWVEFFLINDKIWFFEDVLFVVSFHFDEKNGKYFGVMGLGKRMSYLRFLGILRDESLFFPSAHRVP